MSARALPRYQALKEAILGRISSGELRSQDRVPSENELVAAFGVSRMTANRALRELTDEGYLERIAGVGTFVADLRAASTVLEVRSIAEDVVRRGHEHSARVLALKALPAPDEVAAALQLAPGTEVLAARVVHCEDGRPIQLEERYVLADFAPDFLAQDFTRTTPSAYLTTIAPLQEADQVVRASPPTPEVRAELDMADDEPLLTVLRRTWVSGRPVTYARLSHPGSRFELSAHYIPPGEPGHSPL